MKQLIIFLTLLNLVSCADSDKDNNGGTYVNPPIDYRGRVRKGHVRKSVSTSPNAIKNRNRSKYYYETRGKYRKRKKKDD
jgi:hypothetical protein